jgi:hypothetical protein
MQAGVSGKREYRLGVRRRNRFNCGPVFRIEKRVAMSRSPGRDLDTRDCKPGRTTQVPGPEVSHCTKGLSIAAARSTTTAGTRTFQSFPPATGTWAIFPLADGDGASAGEEPDSGDGGWRRRDLLIPQSCECGFQRVLVTRRKKSTFRGAADLLVALENGCSAVADIESRSAALTGCCAGLGIERHTQSAALDPIHLAF